jgi:hypothetical protein
MPRSIVTKAAFIMLALLVASCETAPPLTVNQQPDAGYKRPDIIHGDDSTGNCTPTRHLEGFC